MKHNAIQAIQLGHLKFSNNLIQGPLAGYSCAPFRVLTARYGKPAFTCTEMISAKDLVYRDQKPKRFIWRDPEEDIVSYQLAANEEAVAAKACEIVAAVGADIIDLNCGCPVNKIRTKGLGSKMLHDTEHMFRVVKSMREATDAVLSVKIRVAGKYQDSDNQALAQAIEAAGADFITVHGRHWRERYDVESRADEIKEVVDAVSIPVVANGNVEDAESLRRIHQDSGCAGFMIARASVGRPWLFQQIIAELNGNEYLQPSTSQIGEIFMEHIDRLKQLESEKLAVLQSRKFAKYYSREMVGGSEFVVRAQQAETQIELEGLIQQYFQ